MGKKKNVFLVLASVLIILMVVNTAEFIKRNDYTIYKNKIWVPEWENYSDYWDTPAFVFEEISGNHVSGILCESGGWLEHRTLDSPFSCLFLRFEGDIKQGKAECSVFYTSKNKNGFDLLKWWGTVIFVFENQKCIIAEISHGKNTQKNYYYAYTYSDYCRRLQDFQEEGRIFTEIDYYGNVCFVYGQVNTSHLYGEVIMLDMDNNLLRIVGVTHTGFKIDKVSVEKDKVTVCAGYEGIKLEWEYFMEENGYFSNGICKKID